MSKWLLLITLGLIISGCGQGNVQFPYPDEQSNYPVPANGMPTVYIAGIVDVRPIEQKRGQGIFMDLTFPSNRKWAKSVDSMYRQALQKIQKIYLCYSQMKIFQLQVCNLLLMDFLLKLQVMFE